MESEEPEETITIIGGPFDGDTVLLGPPFFKECRLYQHDSDGIMTVCCYELTEDEDGSKIFKFLKCEARES